VVYGEGEVDVEAGDLDPAIPEGAADNLDQLRRACGLHVDPELHDEYGRVGCREQRDGGDALARELAANGPVEEEAG